MKKEFLNLIDTFRDEPRGLHTYKLSIVSYYLKQNINNRLSDAKLKEIIEFIDFKDVIDKLPVIIQKGFNELLESLV